MSDLLVKSQSILHYKLKQFDKCSLYHFAHRTLVQDLWGVFATMKMALHVDTHVMNHSSADTCQQVIPYDHEMVKYLLFPFPAG